MKLKKSNLGVLFLISVFVNCASYDKFDYALKTNQDLPVCRCLGNDLRKIVDPTGSAEADLKNTFDLKVILQENLDSSKIKQTICIRFSMNKDGGLQNAKVYEVLLMGIRDKGLPHGKFRAGNRCECPDAFNYPDYDDIRLDEKKNYEQSACMADGVPGVDGSFYEPGADKIPPHQLRIFTTEMKPGSMFIVIFEINRKFDYKTVENFAPTRLQFRSLIRYKYAPPGAYINSPAGYEDAPDTSYFEIISEQLDIIKPVANQFFLLTSITQSATTTAIDLSKEYFDVTSTATSDCLQYEVPPRLQSGIPSREEKKSQMCLLCTEQYDSLSAKRQKALKNDGFNVEDCTIFLTPEMSFDSKDQGFKFAVVFTCTQKFEVLQVGLMGVDQFGQPFGQVKQLDDSHRKLLTDKIDYTIGDVLIKNKRSGKSRSFACPTPGAKDIIGRYAYQSQSTKGNPEMFLSTILFSAKEKTTGADGTLVVAGFHPASSPSRAVFFQIIAELSLKEITNGKRRRLVYNSVTYSKDLDARTYSTASCLTSPERRDSIFETRIKYYTDSVVPTKEPGYNIDGGCGIVKVTPKPGGSSKITRKPSENKKRTTPQSHIISDAKDRVYTGCDEDSKQKGCIPFNSGCLEGRTCPIVATYGGGEDEAIPLENDEIVMEIFGEADKWVALAISDDDRMGDDLVIECCSEKQNIHIYTSWNNKNPKNDTEANKRQTAHDAKSEVRMVRTKREGSFIYCQFYIKEKFTKILNSRTKKGTKIKYDLYKDYHILLAVGDELVTTGIGNLKRHKTGAASFAKIHTLAKRFEPSSAQIKYFKTHGILMTISWFYLLPIGIFIGRYMKETNRNVFLCGTKVWRFVHVALLSVSGLLSLVSVIYQTAGRLGWYLSGRDPFHVQAGWLIHLSTIGLMITGKKMIKSYPVEGFDCMGYLHGFLAHTSYIFGLVVFYRTPHYVTYSTISCSLSPLVIGWIVIYLFMQLPISLHYCWLDYLYSNGWAAVSSSIFVFNTLTLKNNRTADAPGSIVRIKLTLLFVVVTIVYGTIVLIDSFVEKECLDSHGHSLNHKQQ